MLIIDDAMVPAATRKMLSWKLIHRFTYDNMELGEKLSSKGSETLDGAR